MHGARGGAPEGERNGNYRHGARTKEASEPRKLIGGWARSDARSVLVSDRTTTDPLHGVDAHFDFAPLCATVSDGPCVWCSRAKTPLRRNAGDVLVAMVPADIAPGIDVTGIELLLRSSQIAPRAKDLRRSRQGTKTANTPAVNPGEKAIHTERRRRVFAAMTKQLAGAGVRDPSSLRHFSILPNSADERSGSPAGAMAAGPPARAHEKRGSMLNAAIRRVIE